MSEVCVFDHPLIQHKLAYIRDVNTGTKEFRELVNEVSGLMAYEISRFMPLTTREVKTPVSRATCLVLDGKKVCLVPILRAGLGMLDGILKLIPTAKVGHVGLYRDPKTLEAVNYYSRMPSKLGERNVIVIEPMLATGESAVEAIRLLKEMGAKTIKLMSLIAAPEGIELMQKEHPDVDIFIATIDEKLDEKGYIVPGLGDAGDRLFGTE